MPTSTTTLVAEAVRTESFIIDAETYHRTLAGAFAQRPKAPDDKPLDFDPDEL